MHEQMLMIVDKTVERYLCAVRAALRCPEGMKTCVLRYLRQDVAVYAQEGGDLSPDALRARFGAPEEYAAECMERQEVRALARRMQTARFVKRAVLITVVTVAVIAAAVVIGVLIYNNQEPQPWPAGVPYPTV